MQRHVLSAVVMTAVLASGSSVAAQQRFECARRVQGTNFTLTCERAGPTPPPDSGNWDIGIQDLRRYTALNEPAQWLEFNIRGYKNITGRIEITARFHLVGGTFVEVSERITGLQRGQIKDALIIPSIYGATRRWTAVTLSAGRLRCKDCGRHRANSIPESRGLTPGATDDPVELNRIWDEFQVRSFESR